MATKQIAWQTGSGNITLTYQGQGDGPISVVCDANDVGSRSQTITIKTTKGGLITKNVTVRQAACPIPVGTVLNYAYTGSYQEVTLPAGQYKLQCWGAQGGSNGTNSSYGITAKAGGKGGYSEGVLTLSSKTTVRVYVGGQGTSSTGGYNGGGSTTGTSSYDSSGEFGYSKMGGGGGATDIRLSDGALLSRMIVAGGGSGGAMCYKKVTTTVTTWESVGSVDFSTKTGTINGYSVASVWLSGRQLNFTPGVNVFNEGDVVRITPSSSNGAISIYTTDGVNAGSGNDFVVGYNSSSATTFTYIALPKNESFFRVQSKSGWTGTVTFEVQRTSTSTSTYTEGREGYVGGGTYGGAGDTSWRASQTAAGDGGSFGQGGNQTASNYRYCSGGGGGGWYGGGIRYNDSIVYATWHSGGGSGWVNTSASSGNRPSGYTGLQLDSGSTTVGSSSFPAPSGGNETGHAGNGYARITRIS